MCYSFGFFWQTNEKYFKEETFNLKQKWVKGLIGYFCKNILVK